MAKERDPKENSLENRIKGYAWGSREGAKRVVIENVEPEINCGRFPIKRIVGEMVRVEADVFGDGHDEVRARLLWKQDGEKDWQWVEMSPLGNDRWQGNSSLSTSAGTHTHSWARSITSGPGGVTSKSASRRSRISRAVRDRRGHSQARRSWPAKRMRKSSGGGPRRSSGRAAIRNSSSGVPDELAQTVKRYPDLARETRYDRELEVVVDRERARFSAWYELFPRSWSTTPGKHGTLKRRSRPDGLCGGNGL